jgi:hypothetical protein
VEGLKMKSSQIDEVAYDKAEMMLYVKFVRGAWYSYRNVPEEAYRGFLTAPSAGKYFAKEVKGKYEYAKHAGVVSWMKA